MRIVSKVRFIVKRNNSTRNTVLVSEKEQVRFKMQGWKILEEVEESRVHFVFNDNDEFMFFY